MSVLEGQKKEEKRKKNSLIFFKGSDIIAIRINQTVRIYADTFVLMHIEK